MAKISKKILEKIKKEDIKPIGRLSFILKDSFILILFFLNILFGSIGLAICIYLFRVSDIFDLILSVNDFIQILIISIPIIWVLITLLFIFVSYLNFRYSKGGYRFSFIKTTVVPDEDIDCLRSLCRQYYKLSDELTTYKNRLTGIVDQVMLNFTDVFSNVYSKTALAVLDKYPSPSHILKANKKTLISFIAKSSKKGLAWSTEKYELLVLKAKEFKSLSISTPGNLAILKVNISMVRTLQESCKSILDAINEVILIDSLEDIPVLSPIINLLCSIPGIGILTAATILAEVGDFSAFSKPNKLVAFFGIDPSVNQSGEFTGTRNKMSKRGSKLLRRVIFTTALANIRSKRNGEKTNPVMHEFYHQKCINKPKKVALGAVMRKIVNIIFAVLRDQKPFELRTPEEHEELLFAKSLVA